MSRQFLTFAAAATLILAGLTLTQQKLTPSDSGIYGVATIGPTCPVQRLGDNSCADRPYQTRLVVYNYDPTKPAAMIYPPIYATGRKVATFLTGLDGKFRLALAAGDYVIRQDVSDKPPTLYQYDKKVTVTAHTFTEVNLAFDSGIR